MAGCAEPAPVEGTRSFLRAIGSHRGVRAGSNSIWVGSLEAGGGGVVGSSSSRAGAGPGPHPCLSALSSVSTIRNQRYHIHANLSFAVLVAQILLLVSFSFKPGTVSKPLSFRCLMSPGLAPSASFFNSEFRPHPPDSRAVAHPGEAQNKPA